MEARSGGHTEAWSTRIRRVREARARGEPRAERRENRSEASSEWPSGRSGVRVRVSSSLSPLLIQPQRASGQWVGPLALGGGGWAVFFVERVGNKVRLIPAVLRLAQRVDP